jgi:hypothetical protein
MYVNRVESATPRERGQTGLTFNLPKIGAKGGASAGDDGGDEDAGEAKRPLPGSRVERGKLGSAAKKANEAKRASIAEEDDNGDDDNGAPAASAAASLGGRPRPKMSDTVMAAYAAAHRAKQDATKGDEDGW